MSILHQLSSIVDRSHKRLGRGFGSGKGGHTSSRGSKGQRSRTGSKIPLWFEGGQLPLIKRLPMLRGKYRFKVVRPVVELTLSDLEKLTFDQVTLESLKLHKIIEAKADFVKVIATGSLQKKLTLTGIRASAGARKAIEAAGGTVTA